MKSVATGSLDKKVNQLQSNILEMKVKQPPPPPPLQPSTGYHGGQNSAGPVPEWVLRQRKQNSIIIFGLPELEEDKRLQEQLKFLWEDIGIQDLAEGEWSGFRVGKFEDGRKRPVIVKFSQIERKYEVLIGAKNLKGKVRWSGVGITHDLTKFQCLQEKQQELRLRIEADKRNATHSNTGSGQTWCVVGGRGARCVMLLPSNGKTNEQQQQQQQQQQKQ